MFAHDLCHSQIEYFSLRLVDPTLRPVSPTGSKRARRGMLSILIEKTERSLRLVGVVRLRLGERYQKSSILNRQYSIPACPGWVLSEANETSKPNATHTVKNERTECRTRIPSPLPKRGLCYKLEKL